MTSVWASTAATKRLPRAKVGHMLQTMDLEIQRVEKLKLRSEPNVRVSTDSELEVPAS